VQLPFTTEQFFDLLAAYNEAFWPVLVAVWVASLIGSLLAYHVAFFTQINPAAWAFGGLFLLQGALFFWSGVVHGRLSFAPRRNA
jgi:hypothetical protein